MDPYRTPQELVEGLHARQPRARKELFALLRGPIDRLLTGVLKRYGLHEEMGLVVLHGLHHAETHLRFRPTSAVAGLSCEIGCLCRRRVPDPLGWRGRFRYRVHLRERTD